MEKTLRCVVGSCKNIAIRWDGFLLKSRDRVQAGFCEEHNNIVCPNSFKMRGCYGVYNKGIGLVNETPSISVTLHEPPKHEWHSNCCGALVTNTDYDICPDCKEHCEFEDYIAIMGE